MDNHQDQLTFLHLSEADLSRWREDPVTVLFLRHLEGLRRRLQDECVSWNLTGNPRAVATAGAVYTATELYNDCVVSRVNTDETTTDHTFVDPRLKKVRKHGQTDAQ